MSRKISRINIDLHVGDTFVKDLRKTMEDEIRIAAKKWNVNMHSIERRNHVIDMAFQQLQQKIAEVAKVSWDGGDILTIRASNAQKYKDFAIPADLKKYGHAQIVRMRDGWTFTNDDSDDVIPVTDLMYTFTEMIHQWARTAVFYGVASYT